MPRPGPIDRVRAAYAARSGAEAAAALPEGYQRLGRVVLVRWPEALRPDFPFLAPRLSEELGAATVARFAGPASGESRRPSIELLYGTETETEVLEDGIRFRFDALRLLYSRGNRTERARIARLVRPGETVYDLFAGIGYFALPIARHGRPSRVVAVERNPDAYRYLVANVARNRLDAVVRPVEGDNRSVDLPARAADRVLLGYLPDAFPWLERALALVRSEGGWVHAHRIEGSREPAEATVAALRERVEAAGGRVVSASPRVVKAYGPGRDHRVVDAFVRPAS